MFTVKNTRTNVHVRRKRTNKVGEVLIVPIQVPRGDKAGRVLISTNVPIVDKAS